MEPPPRTLYAKLGDLHIAYQVSGHGRLDLLLIPDGIIPIEAMGEEPSFARFLERLNSFARVIRFDRRGMGLSDPVAPSDHPTLEQWAADAEAVLDAAGSRRIALVAMADGGFTATLLAAMRPERISALVLIHGTAGFAIEEFAGGPPARFIEDIAAETSPLGERGLAGIALFAPSALGDERYREWLERSAQRSWRPAMRRALFDVMFRSDLRDILPTVRVPTLVIHRRGNQYLVPEHGRYVADRIPGARFVEVEGIDHVPYIGDATPILDQIEEFLTGEKHAAASDRVLATVLFSDIVGSTEKAAALGDAAWRRLLVEFQDQVGQELARLGGREIDWAGDGVFAAFDGPARAVRCASAIRAAAHRLGLEVRSGVHTGECEVMGPKYAGIAVVVGSRIADACPSGEIIVSSTVKDLVAGSGLRFVDRGPHHLKGVPDEWRLFALDQASVAGAP